MDRATETLKSKSPGTAKSFAGGTPEILNLSTEGLTTFHCESRSLGEELSTREIQQARSHGPRPSEGAYLWPSPSFS
jgi:hypothetical protein